MTDPSVPPPIIILSSPRSYSSLVNAMIGQHPEMYGMPELNLFQCDTVDEFITGKNADGTQKSPFWSSMRHGLLRAVAQIFSGEQTLESIRMAERWLRVREQMTSAEVFQELAAAVAPRRIVEKSPGILRRQLFMDRMLKAAPEARFIHLVRHPLGQGQSMLKAKGGAGVLLGMNCVDHRGDAARLEPQILWHDTQVQILRFLDRIPEGRAITLRAEDFMNSLDATLGALCNWIGVSDAPDAIAAMKQPETSPYSCIGPANARLGNDVNFLNAPALREGKITVPPLDTALPWREDGAPFHPRVQALAQELGYV